MTESICALATPPGRSALAVLRLSGAALLEKIDSFLPADKRLTPRKATYTEWIIDKKVADEVIITYFPAPKSYTGEDVIEITCHGNPIIYEKILFSLTTRGFRTAQPGEFTRRALINKKLLFDEAIAVQEIIDSRSEQDLQASMRLKKGVFNQELVELKDNLMNLCADLTAELDFVEEGLEFASRDKLNSEIDHALTLVSHLMEKSKTADIYRNGLRVAIVGLPNAGKSTLFNQLAGVDKAIVSPMPGTTRDLIMVETSIHGLPVQFTDTAGMRAETTDPIEKVGIEKGLVELEESDLAILVIDSSQSPEDFFGSAPSALQQASKKSNCLTILNKWDIHNADWLSAENFERHIKTSITEQEASHDIFSWLESVIPDMVSANGVQTSIWQKSMLNQLYENFLRFREELSYDRLDHAVQLLYEVIDLIGQLAGEVTNEDLLGRIFARFCVGK